MLGKRLVRQKSVPLQTGDVNLGSMSKKVPNFGPCAADRV